MGLGAEAVCPTTPETVWLELGNQCYHISQRRMSSMKGGQEYCWGIGGYLVEILSAEEEAFLDSFLLEGISYWTVSVMRVMKGSIDGNRITRRQSTLTGHSMNLPTPKK